MFKFNRRNFIRTSLLGGVAASTIPAYAMKILAEQTKVTVDATSRVSLVTGTDRAEMAFRALQPFSRQIAQTAGNRRIIVKDNAVTPPKPLSSIHKDTLEGILEFYKSINKLKNVIVAESTADGPAMPGFDMLGYIPVAEKYKVKLIDLDETTPEILYVVDELDICPKPVRMSSMITDRNNYIMSVARMKTHDRIIATLTLKNIVVGAPIKDPGWGKRPRPPGVRTDKQIVHGNGFRAINYNLFSLAHHIRPDLAFIDGFVGMEGDGPNDGFEVDHRVCVAGLDWLAVDRVGVELMGIDPARLGYLNFCASAGMGQYDIGKIEIVGEKVADHIRTYKMSRNIDKQLQWMTAIKERGESLY